MGLLKIQMYGSFPTKEFSTCAEEGGHVQAIKRGIEFLAKELGPSVVKDAALGDDVDRRSRSPICYLLG